ncbi:hypothetical protein PV04_07866 [Phialophora macrospora]|uniref:RTA1 domain protein n=1 Tax=Phialophora macrospora TaxID=1851006 RepID=A0A0D2G0I6_9EURO|nr:hypothetical protein PV04_07866 [Phialophora macrospora]
MSDSESHYDYSPSLPAAIIMTVAFGCLTALNGFRMVQRRVLFCIPFVVGGALETAGFAARAAGHYDPESTPAYVVQALAILLGPIFFAASVYMTLGRVIRAVDGERHSMMRLTRITKIFVGGDILCFLTQALGGGMLAGADSAKAVDRGENVILAGLILQMLIFGFFLVVAGTFHFRMRRHPTEKSMGGVFNWEGAMFVVYILSALITLRNLFRVIEYIMGEDGYLIQNEWPLYIFDAFLMILVLGVALKVSAQMRYAFRGLSETESHMLDRVDT